jgi:hypothetical protein
MITNLLIRLAGADPNHFDGIEHERTRYAALGAAMLVPPILGGAAVYAASRHLGNTAGTSIALALTWATVILTIDRILVITNLRRVPGEGFRFSTLFAVCFRVALAALVGFAISFFGKLALSADSAKQEIAEETRRQSDVIEKPLLQRLSQIDGMISLESSAFETDLAEEQRTLGAAIAARTAEAQGTGGSRRYGDQGPGYRAAEAEVIQRQAQVNMLTLQHQERRAALLTERRGVEAQIDRVRRDVNASAAHDIFAEIRALQHVLTRQPYLWWFTAFLAACLLLLELVPIVAKSIIVNDSAYALRDRMRSWTEEERVRVEIEAIGEAHARRVELRTEFIIEEAEWESYRLHEKLAKRQGNRASTGGGFSFRPEPPDNATTPKSA